MKDIYSYFENFKELDTLNYRIEREKPVENAIFLRVFAKVNNQLSYLGVTFIKPECFSTILYDKKQFLYPQKVIKLHETPTMLAYISSIESLLMKYLAIQFLQCQKENSRSPFETKSYKKAR